MNKKALQKYSRRWHRRFGAVIGIQFLLWTLGGTYFSWFHIDNVRGQYETKQATVQPELATFDQLIAIQSLLPGVALPAIKEIRVTRWMNKPVVLFIENGDNMEMFDGLSGEKLSPITRQQAIEVARNDFAPEAAITRVTLVTEKGGEYKGPTPAYRIEFDNLKSTHLYVHANSGKISARRNTIWRGFDFLWMLHIVDFQQREDFNNWLLRILSVLGLITIGSGYLLWAVTTPLLRKGKSAV